MPLVLVYALRYMVNCLFAFSNLDKYKDYGFIKIFILSISYAVILSALKFFALDNQMIVIFYTLVMFSILTIVNKLKNFKLNLTYSLFITCLTEYVHFLFFELVSISINILGIADVKSCQPERLLISRIIVFVLYLIAILLIHIFKKINISSIKKLSNYTILPIFLSIALLVVTGLKYCIKYAQSNELHDILSFVFAGFMVVYFVFIFSSETFLDIIENLSSKKLNPAIEKAKLQKSKGFIGLKFISQELNLEMNRFLNMLGEIDMYTEDKKSKQIAYCAVLLNHEENPQSTNMISVIYPIVGDILDRQAKTIESNISNAIKTHWTSCSAETLEKIKMNYKKPISPENGCPSAKEFLLYLTQKYKAQYPEDEIKSNAEYSFFKKHLLNIQN